jgi:ATP synthase protein I
MDSPHHDPPSKPNRLKERSALLKYSGLGVQLACTLGLAVWIGYRIDKALEFQFPVFLLTFLFGALVGSMYMLIKSLPK